MTLLWFRRDLSRSLGVSHLSHTDWYRQLLDEYLQKWQPGVSFSLQRPSTMFEFPIIYLPVDKKCSYVSLWIIWIKLLWYFSSALVPFPPLHINKHICLFFPVWFLSVYCEITSGDHREITFCPKRAMQYEFLLGVSLSKCPLLKWALFLSLVLMSPLGVHSSGLMRTSDPLKTVFPHLWNIIRRAIIIIILKINWKSPSSGNHHIKVNDRN